MTNRAALLLIAICLLTSSSTPLSHSTGTSLIKKRDPGSAANLTVIASVKYAPTVYYVATNGDDSNPGTEDEPFRTLVKGVSALAARDTLYVKEGIYAESLYNNIPGGTSWTAPVTVATYPSHKVTIRPEPGASRVLNFEGAPTGYIIIRGFILDAVNVTHDAVKITSGPDGPSHHIRIENCEIKNAPQQGVLMTRSANYNELINLAIHDNGTTDFHHGIYISTEYNLVEGSRIYQNAGWGVHIYSEKTLTAHYNLVRNNLVYNNGRAGRRGVGILLGSGRQNIAYNNIVVANRTLGIQVDNDSQDAGVYHNVVYANRTFGIFIDDEAFGTIVRNNIVYQNTVDVQDHGTGTVQDHNLIGVDPHFLNPASFNFRLKPSSPAIDAGTPVTAVTTDFDRTPRPRGPRPDIGAFEFVPPPAR